MSATKINEPKEAAVPTYPQRGMSDIGRVILPEGTHGMVREEIIHVPPVRGAIKGLSKCVRKYGAQNMVLVSRVRSNRRELLEAWLEEQKIFQKTGLINDREHLIWCETWRAKGPILREHGITFCIDDNPEVHLSIEAAHNDLDLENDSSRLRQYGFNYTEEDLEEYRRAPTRVKLIQSWDDLIRAENL